MIIASLVDRGFSAQALLLALSEARLEVAREARLEIMGELTASIAHELNQPLTAIVTNGEFCLRNLSSGTPDQKRLREAVTQIVHDGNRAKLDHLNNPSTSDEGSSRTRTTGHQ